MSKKSTNPRNIPRTQADVDRARQLGIREGSDQALAIMLSALLDKFNAQDYVVEIFAAFSELSKEILSGRISVADLRCTLREEYGLNL